MRNYAEMELFTLRALAQLEWAERVVRYIPDLKQGWIRCHEVARIVRNCLDPNRDMLVKDGCFGIVDHSWLVIADGDHRFILDPYAIGRLPQVQLIDPFVPGVLSRMYRAGRERNDINERLVEEATRTVRRSLTGCKIGVYAHGD